MIEASEDHINYFMHKLQMMNLETCKEEDNNIMTIIILFLTANNSMGNIWE